jgi:hypothetical protein
VSRPEYTEVSQSFNIKSLLLPASVEKPLLKHTSGNRDYISALALYKSVMNVQLANAVTCYRALALCAARGASNTTSTNCIHYMRAAQC